MITEKNIETCPGFGKPEKGSAPYSGKKFNEFDNAARKSDPVYDSGEEVQSPEEDEPSEGTPPGVF